MLVSSAVESVSSLDCQGPGHGVVNHPPEVRPTYHRFTHALRCVRRHEGEIIYARRGVSNAPSSPHMALSHESMPIITVGAYRCACCRSQSRSTEVRERARQQIAPLACAVPARARLLRCLLVPPAYAQLLRMICQVVESPARLSDVCKTLSLALPSKFCRQGVRRGRGSWSRLRSGELGPA